MTLLVAVYIIALIVGGGLLFVSVFLTSHGGGDFHADASGGLDAHSGDLHHAGDFGHAMHGPHGLSLTGWFSMQFAIYFLAVFGLIGTTMTYMAEASPSVVLAVAATAGVVIGQVVHHVLRSLKRSGVSSGLQTGDYIEKAARVTIAIEPPRRGEVAIGSRNGERFVAAVARRNDDRFMVGERVVVVGLNQGVAEVVSREEFEFLSGSRTGEHV
jgi:hypothetical protein